MSLRFSHTSGEHLPLIEGLPENYQGPLIKGARASHAIGAFGNIIVQEFQNSHLRMRLMIIDWKKPERLVCHYTNPPVICSRVVLNNSLYEVIKGSGDIYLTKDQFYTLSGSKWTGLILSKKAGEHQFLDLMWPPDNTYDSSADDQLYKNGVKSFYEGLPHMVHPPHSINIQMHHVIEDLLRTDYTDAGSKHLFFERMWKYRNLMLEELRTKQSLKRNIRETDWYGINKAMQIINENLATPFTTQELSIKIGVNEHKLKKLFPKVTGFTIEEYRKYQLLINVGKRLVMDREIPLKLVYADSGYNSVPSFVRGFNKMCHCTPAELRDDSWDISKMVNYPIPEN